MKKELKLEDLKVGMNIKKVRHTAEPDKPEMDLFNRGLYNYHFTEGMIFTIVSISEYWKSVTVVIKHISQSDIWRKFSRFILSEWMLADFEVVE